jgi:adenylate kinase
VSTPLFYFFKEHNSEFRTYDVFQGEGVNCQDIDINALFESLKLGGELVNFKQIATEFENFLTEKEIELQNEALEKYKEAKAENEDKMHEGKENRQKVIEQKKEAIRESEINIIENKSVAIRTYLTDNVMDKLTEGLIETCKVMPDDPVIF